MQYCFLPFCLTHIMYDVISEIFFFKQCKVPKLFVYDYAIILIVFTNAANTDTDTHKPTALTIHEPRGAYQFKFCKACTMYY